MELRVGHCASSDGTHYRFHGSPWAVGLANSQKFFPCKIIVARIFSDHIDTVSVMNSVVGSICLVTALRGSAISILIFGGLPFYDFAPVVFHVATIRPVMICSRSCRERCQLMIARLMSVSDVESGVCLCLQG